MTITLLLFRRNDCMCLGTILNPQVRQKCYTVLASRYRFKPADASETLHTNVHDGVYHAPLGRLSMVNIPAVGIMAVPKKVGFRNISPRAFRRCIVRYWHPLVIVEQSGLGNRPRGAVIYTVVYGTGRLIQHRLAFLLRGTLRKSGFRNRAQRPALH